jgi:hypothetical protein
MKESLRGLSLALWVALLAAASASAQEKLEMPPAAADTPPKPFESSGTAPTAAPAERAHAEHEVGSPRAHTSGPTVDPLTGLPPGRGDAALIEPEPTRRWLDEVRAQRRAWEDRRRAAKEAMDARRRWIDPWGAAQHEAIEQEVQRRRDAFRERIERDREAFRSQRPWYVQPAPWEEETAKPGEGISGTPETGRLPGAPDAPYPQLPGWDNRWYYRGY